MERFALYVLILTNCYFYWVSSKSKKSKFVECLIKVFKFIDFEKMKLKFKFKFIDFEKMKFKFKFIDFEKTKFKFRFIKNS